MNNENNNGFENGNQQTDNSYYGQTDQNQQNYYYDQTGANADQSTQNQQSYYYGQNGDANQNSYGQQNYYSQNGNTNQNGYGQQNYYSQNGNTNQNSYGQQNYYNQNGSTNQNPYGQMNQQYGGQNYYGQGYGSAPLDSNGNPMKNRFGMKLTFSILEIISCNLISLICGIIACVYTTKANTSYKEARWEDFKSQAKTSAVCLWIGLVGVILEVIVSIVLIVAGVSAYSALDELGYYDYYEDDYDYDLASPIIDSDDYSYEDTEESEDSYVSEESTPYVEGEGLVEARFTLEGVEMTLPISYSDFEALGFAIPEDDKDYVINVEESGSFDLLSPSGDELGYVYIKNVTDDAIDSVDGIVVGMSLYYDEYQDVFADFVLYNGLSDKSTPEELIETMGSPDYESVADDNSYAYYDWYSYSEDDYSKYKYLEYSYDEGGLYKISIQAYDFD